jgi:hypothetical protein
MDCPKIFPAPQLTSAAVLQKHRVTTAGVSPGLEPVLVGRLEGISRMLSPSEMLLAEHNSI